MAETLASVLLLEVSPVPVATGCRKRRLAPVWVAVAAVQGNYDSVSSPDIAALAAQVVQLVATYTNKTP